jgi:transcriptional regulator with XRE-family HTH domain
MSKRFNHLASIMREHRAIKNVSQADVAKVIWGNGKGQFVSNIERGLCSLPTKKIPHVAKFLDIPVNKITHAMMKDFEANLGAEIQEAIP